MVIKERRLKRIFDIISSGTLLVILSPAFLIIALALKAEGLLNPVFKGPVFHREPRISKGQTFPIYKFRIITAKYLKQIKENPTALSISAFTGKKNT